MGKLKLTIDLGSEAKDILLVREMLQAVGLKPESFVIQTELEDIELYHAIDLLQPIADRLPEAAINLEEI